MSNDFLGKPPRYLFKILSIEQWEKSQNRLTLQLPPADSAFVHLAKKDQLEKIITKFWSEIPTFVICQIDIVKVKGKLVYESNPGGSNKYYHLYEGTIPCEAIVDFKIIKISEK